MITASHVKRSSSATGPSLSMPRSSFCSERQTSSSLMRRFIAPRPFEEDDDLDFFFALLVGPPPGLELESGRF